MNIRILVAHANDKSRSHICSLINSRPEMVVAGETKDTGATIELIDQLHPDVILLEIIIPDSNGVASILQITVTYPKVKVIALSKYPDTRIIVEAFKEGASGFLLKDCLSGDLGYAIHSAMANKFYLDEASVGLVMEYLLNKYPPSDIPALLSLMTKRELKIFISITEGIPLIQIAWDMDMDINTVALIKRQIMGLMVNLYSMKEHLL